MEYKKDRMMEYSDLDPNLELNIVGATLLLQNTMTEFYGTFNCDNITVKKECNAAWVYTKIKIHFFESPKWTDLVKCTGYITKNKPIRTENEMEVKSKKGDVIVRAKLEACVIDLESRKARKINTTNFPDNIECSESKFEEGFKRLTEEFTDKDKVYNTKVKITDIDYTRHTNNVSYVRYILNCFDSNFIDKYKVEDFEIHYISESKEKDTLEIYMKEIKEEQKIEFLIREKSNKKECVRAYIKYSDK